MTRIVCRQGEGSRLRCRRTATRLVVWPTSAGGQYRCEEHANALAALLVIRARGPVSVEAIR